MASRSRRRSSACAAATPSTRCARAAWTRRLSRPPSAAAPVPIRGSAATAATTSTAPAAGSSAAVRGTSPGRSPLATARPATAIAAKVARLVSRKTATVRLTANARGTPARDITRATIARPLVPPAGSSTLTPCAVIAMSTLERTLPRRSIAPWKTAANDRVDASSSRTANASHSGLACAR